MIDSLRTHQAPFLHLDIGNFASTDEATGEYETRFIWETMERTGVSAVSPGPRELIQWAVFSDLMRKGTIPVVCSNVTQKIGGRETPIGSKYLILPVNGIKVALFALMGGSEFSTVPVTEGVEFGFSDPFETASALVPQLHKEADLVVLLSEMSPSDSDRLLQGVNGIDVALYGFNPPYITSATQVGSTIVNQTGIRGQYAGKLTLILDPAGKIVDFGSDNPALDKAIPEDPEVAKLVAAAQDKSKEIRAAARDKRQSEFEKKLSGERFLGAETCKRCHQTQYDQWASSPHAHSFASLETPVKGKSRGPECLVCHVTGYQQSGGFTPNPTDATQLPAGKPDLASVQCEACHGQGTSHQRTGSVKIAEATCRGCHTPEWSPKFEYQAALQAIKH